MAIYSSTSTTNWTFSLKLLLISTGVLSMAFVMKLSVPVVTDFVATEVPSIWSVVLSWLRPPYLYILINCIIISIVASSKLQQKVEYYPAHPPEMVVPQPVVAEAVKVSGSDVRTDYAEAYGGAVLTGYGYDANAMAKVYDGSSVAVADDVQRWAGVVEKTVSDVKEMVINDQTVAKGGDDVAVVSASVGKGLQRKDSLEVLFSNGNEKPPVSARFGHRKAVKASPEGGKSLGVSKPKRHETLESTWKTITEGRSMPLTRHLKKCDTWESHARRNMQMEQNTPPTKLMKKSETFSDRNGTGSPDSKLSPSSGSGKLKKEPSLSQDELNRRVEAFIKKFNEEMRLQRQQSLNQYQEMIRRGAH
ncbi:uncharacterized protein LOC107430433 [Ziziphus jujuba]|uniref:Uncharacterized protein LOC107430433 n=1 Tax=Ziziphus jujuba TaxID=326968 RepID=A0A6P4AN62_ZIZJJ|nr:uncharacterized protein LOC107430433 [Ziziphus jujuba]